MAVFNFKERFIEPIERGTKGGTIRAYRRHPQKLDMPMHLYHGLRQFSPAYRIQPSDTVPFCVAIYSVIITKSCEVHTSNILNLPKSAARNPGIWTSRKLTVDERARLARFDGFDSFAEMMSFWDGRLPFLGHWYCWKDPNGKVFNPPTDGLRAKKLQSATAGILPRANERRGERRQQR